jgi:hypothetical protein
MLRRTVVDEFSTRLYRAGWSVGDACLGAAWLVSGANGENAIRAVGPTQAAAWRRACDQAAAVGMLGRAAHQPESR